MQRQDKCDLKTAFCLSTVVPSYYVVTPKHESKDMMMTVSMVIRMKMTIMGMVMNKIIGMVMKVKMRMMTTMLLTYGNLGSPALLNVRPDDRDVVLWER